MKNKSHPMRPITDIGTRVSSDVQTVQRLSLGMQVVATFIIIGSLVASIGIGLNFIVVPGTDVLQQTGPTANAGQPFYLSLWYPFQSCAGSPGCGGLPYQLLPTGWPSSTADSNRIVGSGANTVVAGAYRVGQQYSSSQPDPSIVSLLNWAQTAGIKVELDDVTTWSYLKGSLSLSSNQLNDHIQGLVRNYGSHAGLGGWYIGNEPEGWGSTAIQKEGMYARYADVVARFKAADPNHRVYASTASGNKLRFCREGQPSILLNSGFSYFRSGTIADDSQRFQDGVDRAIANFDDDYLCTKNYGIPAVYSFAANYWAGDTITAAETRMYAYTFLAHGGQGIEWFPWSTTGGLVWDNQAPAYALNFQNWLPSMQGGKIYLDSAYQNVVGFNNVGLAVDTMNKHSGQYAAKVNISGPVTNYHNLRVNPPENANAPWPPKFAELDTNSEYRLSGWVKTDGLVSVQLKATGPGFSSYSSTQSGTGDWTELSVAFTTPATSGRWTFGPWINATGAGTVWFDDISLVQSSDVTQRNILEDFNPGFETVTGADRTPREPLAGTVTQLNNELEIIGPVFSGLQKLVSFHDQQVPTSGLVTALSSSVTQGLPRAEMGIFSSGDVAADYYVVVVNRNISSAADVSFNVTSANTISLQDVLTGSTQNYSSNGSVVPVTITLPAGAGKAFKVGGVQYNAPVATPVYQEDFEDGSAQGWTTQGGTWSVVDDGGNNVYDVNATSDARGINTSLTAGDFEYRGRFKIMPDHDTSSILHFTFRKDGTNPNLGAQQYNFRVQLDPGAESTNGYVQWVRTSQNSAVLCQVNDENFLRGDRYIDFSIRGIGNVVEASFDGVRYLTCIDPNAAERLSSGQVGFRIYEGGHVRLDDLSVSTLSQTDSTCQESWTCSDWSTCNAGQQSRTCTDQNACGSVIDRPALTQSCVVNGNTNTNTNTNTNSNTNAPACTEHWSCTAWSACVNDSQSRTCTDDNACGTIVNKPPLTQSCTVPPPPPPPPPVTCTQDWQCGEWTACDAQNRQTRRCVDVNQCSTGGQALAYDDIRACDAGGTDDLTPPETTTPSIDPVIFTNVARLSLAGTDNVTAPANLRFTYRVDGGQARIAPAGSTLFIRDLSNDKHTVVLQAIDEAGNADPTPVTLNFTVKNVLSIVTAPRGRVPAEVRTFDYLGRLRSRFTAFSGLSTGASVAVLDVEGDGTGEIAVAPGRGGPPEVRIFTSKGKLLRRFNVFPKGFSGGVNLAAADLDGDGADEIIAAQASGTGSFVRVYTSKGRFLGQTTVLGKSFRGGVAIAAGQISATEPASILTAPASNGSPTYNQYRFSNGRFSLIRRVRLPVTQTTVGATLAIGNLDNWGNAEIIASVSTAQQATQFFVLSSSGRRLTTITAPNNQRGAIALAAGDLRSFDNRGEVVAVTANPVPTRAFVFTSPNATVRVNRQVTAFTPYAGRRWGMNVDVGHL
jgi:hypothetical protein